jgi:hypothetical protein
MRFGSFHISDEFVNFIEEYTAFNEGYTTIFYWVAAISSVRVLIRNGGEGTYLVYRSCDLAV